MAAIDYVGGFAVTAGLGIEKHIEKHSKTITMTITPLCSKLLLTDLAEALAEYLHERIRRVDFWGYSKNEKLSNEELVQEEKYSGIRPAPGYPACPDHTEKIGLFQAAKCSRTALG